MRISFIAVLVVSASCLAGVVQTRDGERIEGDIRRASSGWEVTTADGKVRIIAEDQVSSIQTSTTSSDPATRLGSLRRAVDSMDDISQILARYEQAMAQLKGTPAQADAEKDVQKWKEFQQTGMQKIGREWLTREQVDELDAKNTEATGKAIDLLKSNRQKDAATAVEKILDSEPNNVSALYLRGLIAFRQDQVPVARRAFEQVIAQLPDHGPSLNNLAVVQYRQNANAISLTNFHRAMLAMPLNATVCDNVAEVLNKSPADGRDTPALRKLQAQFQQDEPRLEAQMKEVGRYRWGATWVSEQEMSQLQQQEEKRKAELDRVLQDYDGQVKELGLMDARIQQNDMTLTRADSNRYVQDAQGRVVMLPPNSRASEAARENDQLRAARREEMNKLDRIREALRQVQEREIRPTYTGQLHLLDEQFTPAKTRGK